MEFQIVLPEVGVALLYTGKSPVEFGQVCIALGFGELAIQIDPSCSER